MGDKDLLHSKSQNEKPATITDESNSEFMLAKKVNGIL